LAENCSTRLNGAPKKKFLSFATRRYKTQHERTEWCVDRLDELGGRGHGSLAVLGRGKHASAGQPTTTITKQSPHLAAVDHVLSSQVIVGCASLQTKFTSNSDISGAFIIK
jgi:hypothetical protein